jgi:signal peptidase I
MRPARIVSLLFSLLVTVGLWLLVAPSHLGGQLAYVSISGTSMNPRIHAGDVVVLRPSPPYRIGDVVAYRSSTSPAPVLHRIIDVIGDRFLLQGDNNDFVDAYLPTTSDIIGQEVLLIPNGVALVHILTRPWFVITLGVLSSVFAAVLGLRQQRRRRRTGRSRNQPRRRDHDRDHGGPPDLEAPAAPQLPDPPVEAAPEPVMSRRADAAGHSDADGTGLRWQLLRIPGRPVAWMVLSAVFIVLTQVAWRSPLDADAAQTRPMLVKYKFDYRADLPPNPVYEAPVLDYGDTIFLTVVDEVDVTVRWTVPKDGVVVNGGALTLRTTINSTAGWSRELATAGPVPITGPEATINAPVDFGAALALAAEIDAIAGVTGRVTVDVVATAVVDGATTTGSTPSPLSEQTSSTMSFALTANTAALTNPPTPTEGTTSRSSAAAASSGPTGGKGLAAQASTQSGGSDPKAEAVIEPGVREVVQWVRTARLVPNRLALGPLSIDVATLRWSSLAGLLVCLLFGFGGVAVESRARSRGEAAYIDVLHGARLIPVRDVPLGRAQDVVDLAGFDALLAIGRRLDLPVMVEAPRPGTRSRTTRYYVNDGPTTYRYVASNDGPANGGKAKARGTDGGEPVGGNESGSGTGPGHGQAGTGSGGEAGTTGPDPTATPPDDTVPAEQTAS